MAEVLNVESRDLLGKRNARRMRRDGKLPAVLYGHGQGTVSLVLSSDELDRVLRHGGRLVDLKGKVNESALIRELQWDTYGHGVLHVDLIRVSSDEKLTVEVEVELRGVSPGVKTGGVVTQLVHSVEIETTPAAIPDRLHLNINQLQLDQTLTAADIEDLPEGAKLLTEPDTILVQCVVPEEETEEEASSEGVEPELIGRKASEEGEEDED